MLLENLGKDLKLGGLVRIQAGGTKRRYANMQRVVRDGPGTRVYLDQEMGS